MIRTIISIMGKVQEAGYRAFVLDVGRELKLEGIIENLPDGTVRVICEGEKENIEKLIKSIKIKTETVEVKGINVSYEESTNEFRGKGFIAKITDFAQELFQGYATAAKYFKIGWDKQDKMLGKQDKMLEKQDETSRAIKSLHKDTIDRFDWMVDKYGDMSKILVFVDKKLDFLTKLFEKLVNHFIKEK